MKPGTRRYQFLLFWVFLLSFHTSKGRKQQLHLCVSLLQAPCTCSAEIDGPVTPNPWHKSPIPFPSCPIKSYPPTRPKKTPPNKQTNKKKPNKIHQTSGFIKENTRAVVISAKQSRVATYMREENGLMSVGQRKCFCQIFRSARSNHKAISVALVLLNPTTYFKLWLDHQLSLLKKEDKNLL